MSKQLELIKVIKQNPDLPVVPMVDGEIVTDDFGYYLAEFGHAAVDEFVISRRDIVLFKSDDDVFDTLERCLTDEEFEALPETEEECRPFYDALPWTKAIIVYIKQFRWDEDEQDEN